MTIPLLRERPDLGSLLARAEVLYTDLDGTLLGRGGSILLGGENEPSLATVDAVLRLNAAGLTVVLTTGRNRLQCTEITRLLGWRGFIAELGCVTVPDRGADPIYLTGDWPADALAPGETPHQRIERAGALAALAEAFPGKLEPHAPYHLDREATVLLRGDLDLGEAQALLDTLDVPVDIVDNGIIHPLSTGLVGVEEIHAYHLMPPGVTKAKAVAIDVARRGLTREQAVAIGDSASDVPMAEVTALTMLVANALGDARVQDAARPHDNVAATSAKRGAGWAEFADAWLAARGLG